MEDFDFEYHEPEKKRNINFNPSKKTIKLVIIIVAIAIVAIYFLSGLYMIDPAEIGLVKTFGKYVGSTGPGLNYHIPAPFQSVVKVNVSTLRKEEIGFRTYDIGKYSTYEEEALMLTGDGNFVSLEAVVQYYISDPEQYIFNLLSNTSIYGTDDIVRFTVQSVLREEVAANTVDAVLTTQRDVIAAKATAKVQDQFDELEIGIQVKNVYLQEVSPPKQVIEAFDDVNNAKQDQDKLVNQATQYKNDVVPKAQGQAAQIIKEAEAYSEQVVLKASGEANRFSAVLKEYLQAPEITRKRMYLETINDVLDTAKKFVVLDSNEVFKFLDLNNMIGGDSND